MLDLPRLDELGEDAFDRRSALPDNFQQSRPVDAGKRFYRLIYRLIYRLTRCGIPWNALAPNRLQDVVEHEVDKRA